MDLKQMRKNIIDISYLFSTNIRKAQKQRG